MKAGQVFNLRQPRQLEVHIVVVIQVVQADHPVAWPLPGHMKTDETGSAGNQSFITGFFAVKRTDNTAPGRNPFGGGWRQTKYFGVFNGGDGPAICRPSP